MQIMERRILEQDDTGRHFDAAHDDVYRRAAPRPVNLPVRNLSGPVFVTTERVEVVLLVVIERRLIPQSLPDRIRVVIDLEIKRVVIHINRARFGHLYILLDNIGWGAASGPRSPRPSSATPGRNRHRCAPHRCPHVEPDRDNRTSTT